MASATLKAARTKAINALYRGGGRGGKLARQFRKSFKDGSPKKGVQNARYRYLRDRSIARRDARMTRIASGNAKTVRALTPFRKRSAGKATSARSSGKGSSTSNS